MGASADDLLETRSLGSRRLALPRVKRSLPVEGSCLAAPGIPVSETPSQPAHRRSGQAHRPAGENDPLFLRRGLAPAQGSLRLQIIR
jgi:hypothetical protein